jgi:hypothetical protein
VTWFPVLLVVHIALAVSLLAPSLVLPFLLRGDPETAPTGGLRPVMLSMQGTGSVVLAIGLGLTGAGLVASLGSEILSKPWLLVALAIYGANLLLAAFISRPGLRRLMGLSTDPSVRRRDVGRVRYTAYAMGLATMAIGFLMSTKPLLW